MATITTATATLGLEISLGSIRRTVDTDLSLNVYRRHESIVYKSSDLVDAANVAFFGSQPLISTSNLHIADRSASLVANRIERLDRPVSVEGFIEYEVPTDKFIVTDIYAAEDNSNTSTPLFYQHVFSRENLPRVSSLDDLTISPGYSLVAFQVLDQDFNSVKLDNVKLNDEDGTLANNLVSSFDQETGKATVYYVRYSVKNPSNVISSYVELLSNETVFTEADFDDLDENMTIIDDGRKVYLIEEQESSLTVKLPHLGNYSFQLLEDARIRILPPPQSDKDDVWNVAVTNGKVFAEVDGVDYRYSIGEFLDQAWDPEAPYKMAVDEDAEFISANLVKVRRQNVLNNPTTSGYIDMLVYDSDNEGVAAFTTDPSKEDTVAANSQLFELWSPITKVGIRSVDSLAGIIDIDGFELRSDYKILATYRYEESNYEVTAVDFNPVNNPDILTQFVSFFVDPDYNSSVKPNTLYFTVTDRAGKIITSNLPNFDNNAEMIQTEDGRWREVYYEDIPDFASPSQGTIIFIDQYTVIGSGIFLPLGDVHVSEDSHPDLSTIIDVRVRGGGVKEEEVDNAKESQQEVEWYWDLGFWDGTPYPGTASYFVEVPAEVLEIAGGTMRAAEVRSVIDRHTAAGVYAIAKAYGIDPVISGVMPASGQVTIKWGSYT